MELKFLGAIISICSNLLISVSFNVQRHAHTRASRGKTRSYKLKEWWLGLGMMIFGEFGNFAGYAFAPASLISPLGAITVVSNALIAYFFLKERILKLQVFGVLLALGGGIVIVIFSPNTKRQVGVKEMLANMGTPVFIVYVSLMVVGLVTLFILSWRNFGARFVLVPILICSLLGAFTVIGSKGFATLLRVTIQGHNQMCSPMPYIFLAIAGITAITQVKFLNNALYYFPSSIVIPIYFCIFTTSTIIAGIIFFKEFEQLTVTNIVMFILGVLLAFSGVYFISSRRMEASPEDAASEEKPQEDEVGLLSEAEAQPVSLVDDLPAPDPAAGKVDPDEDVPAIAPAQCAPVVDTHDSPVAINADKVCL
eukprot:gnl/Trimastix_PCT/1460.p1 GENE.gnl/Trimastix_PCT/1460~~gnl/Trimastix_PCT/1460.p1  ORF type:complete len:367 (+),score=69.99 gnl/Trimastix_PCT/1460:61-1161(+)